MSDRGTIHVNQPLSKVIAGTMSNDYIWNRVLPAVPVPKKTDNYFLFGEEFLMYQGRVRADKTRSPRVNAYSAETKTFSCKQHSYHDIVSDEELNTADAPIKPRMRVSKNINKIVDLDIEVDVASQVLNSSNYTGMTSSPTVDWNATSSGSDPIGDIKGKIRTVQQEVGAKPNILVINGETFDQLSIHPQLIEYFKYTSVPVLTEDLLAKAFGLKEVIVGDGIYRTSKAGQSTVTKGGIWKDSAGNSNAALLYRTDNPAKEEPSWGYTFLHQLYGGLTAKVKNWREEGLDGEIIEVTRSYDVKVTGQKGGYLFTSVI